MFKHIYRRHLIFGANKVKKLKTFGSCYQAFPFYLKIFHKYRRTLQKMHSICSTVLKNNQILSNLTTVVAVFESSATLRTTKETKEEAYIAVDDVFIVAEFFLN